MIAAPLDLIGFRNDPLWEPIVLTGIDLTGAVMALAVRQYPDQAGPALLSLGTTAIAGGEGIRLVSVDLDADGIPESSIEIISTKAQMQALPVAAVAGVETGEDAVLYHDFDILPAPGTWAPWSDLEQTHFFGKFIVKGSAAA